MAKITKYVALMSGKMSGNNIRIYIDIYTSDDKADVYRIAKNEFEIYQLPNLKDFIQDSVILIPV